jgi:hypothetical protein
MKAKALSHSLFLSSFLLLFAGAAKAQVVGHDFYRPSNNVYADKTVDYGIYDYPYTAPAPAATSSVAQDSTGYAGRDPGSIPGTYMDYDQAVALGRAMLASAAQPLGDFARALRANAVRATSPKKSILQDDQGRVLLCDAKATNCRVLPPSPDN